MHPGKGGLAEDAHALYRQLNPFHVSTFPTSTKEVDIWTDGYLADKRIMVLIRKKFHENLGKLINLKRPRERLNMYAKIIQFPDLIVQKADLLINPHRQQKA
eukprot:842-Amphidinium_carterae.1